MLALLGNKYFLWVVIAVLAIGGTAGILKIKSCANAENEQLQTYNRQLQGQLSDKERELQSAHYDIGVAESKFMTQQQLAEKLKKDKEDISKEFDSFVASHNLQIESYQKTIAELNQIIHGGTSSVVVDSSTDLACKDIEKCKVSYSWRDNYNRFRLVDPNIFAQGNETFTSSQHFRIVGKIYKQKDGFLKISQLTLKELYLADGNSDYQEIPGGELKIDTSEFDYSEDRPIAKEYSLFRLRAIAMGSVTALSSNGSGALSLGFGLEWFSYKGFGISSSLGFDFKDIKHFAPYIGVEYNPTILGTELNLGIGTSIGTPFTGLFKEYIWNVNLIFYLNN
jgi:hypothetical protein